MSVFISLITTSPLQPLFARLIARFLARFLARLLADRNSYHIFAGYCATYTCKMVWHATLYSLMEYLKRWLIKLIVLLMKHAIIEVPFHLVVGYDG